ncbi:hypothetical protein GCM10023063_48790 [Arthrobacter methylotrophus]
MPGWVKLEDGSEKEVTLIDAFEAVGACAAGKMSRGDLDRIERAICPGEGACGGMYTATPWRASAKRSACPCRLCSPALGRPPS